MPFAVGAAGDLTNGFIDFLFNVLQIRDYTTDLALTPEADVQQLSTH